jgi:predicted dehydrogenase
VREGFVGKLHTVRVGLPGGTPDYGKVADQTATEPVPWGFDYERWLGPAPLNPFCPARVGVNFRWVRDYSGGQVTDWGAHHIDMAHWGMDRDSGGPVTITNAKGVFAEGPVYDTATEFSFEAHYADGVRIHVTSEGQRGPRFEGSDGWLWVNRGGRWESHDEKALKKEEKRLKKAKEATAHVTNFLDAVLDGATPVAPIETAHRSVTVAHLGNIAMLLGRDLRWDPVSERVENDAEANRMLDRRYREPWTVLR